MHISQREAHRLKRRVMELERDDAGRRSRWSADWPGGVLVGTIAVSSTEWWIVRTVRAMGHACVLVNEDQPKLRVYALKHPAEKG